MDSNVLIVGIVVLGLVVVVVLLRDRITALIVRGSATKQEGEVRFEADKPRETKANDARASVSIRGNKSLGKSKMQVSRDDVEISDNLTIGEQEFKVEDHSKKKK
ncbi:hypothetical protein FBQ82_20950 [Anaerolineae bacterium CFX7]|nr:hypothetical protein [Anaerolineae bacterium CFX7]